MSVFGSLFRVSTFGESHCSGVGCIVDGVPPRLPLTPIDIQQQLDRRRPGQSALTTARAEEDKVEIVSGTEGGFTLGTPICLLVRNKDQRPGDYSSMSDIPRPSHADYTYQGKYGIRATSGGGRASARETIGRVAAGAIADKWLNLMYGITITGWVSSVGDVNADRGYEFSPPSRVTIDSSPVRCPDRVAEQLMVSAILSAKSSHDSVGGVITCVALNVPVGWGEPVFDKLEASLAHAMLSIPATKGFEIGSGFAGTKMRGSQHNDPFISRSSSTTTTTESDTHDIDSRYTQHVLLTAGNNSGGIQGGISNGNPIVFRVAFKPPATIGLSQSTVDFTGQSTTLSAEGRHDPCVVPRAVPIVESMCSLVLADAAMKQEARIAATKRFPVQGKVRPASNVTFPTHQPQQQQRETEPIHQPVKNGS